MSAKSGCALLIMLSFAIQQSPTTSVCGRACGLTMLPEAPLFLPAPHVQIRICVANVDQAITGVDLLYGGRNVGDNVIHYKY
jgi:hypothetical protein